MHELSTVTGMCACPTVDGDPFVEVFTGRQGHGEPQITTTKRGFGILLQLILVGALGDVLLGAEGLGILATMRRISTIIN